MAAIIAEIRDIESQLNSLIMSGLADHCETRIQALEARLEGLKKQLEELKKL